MTKFNHFNVCNLIVHFNMRDMSLLVVLDVLCCYDFIFPCIYFFDKRSVGGALFPSCVPQKCSRERLKGQ